MTLRIELGSGNLKGSFGFGEREDYTYDVPDGAIHVSLSHEDVSKNTLNFGSGNGKVSLNWDKINQKAHVHAWVNGAVGSPNEVRWIVYAYLTTGDLPGKMCGKHDLQLQVISHPQQSTYFNEALRRGKVPFLHHHTLEFSSSGHDYTDPDYDISVKIPQGAVAEGEIIHIEVAVALYGPFVPQGITRPISPIIWVCIMEENALLKKPFQIIIPHCLVGLSDEQLQLHGVHFAKASHSNYYFDSYGQLRYKFEKCSMKPQFISSGDKTYAILETDHCCFYCLTANKTHQMSLDAGYSLTRIESFAQHKSKVHFVATYFLDTCIQSLKDQYPEQEGYVIARTDLFKFKEDKVQEHIKIILPQSKATSHYIIGMEPAEAKINMSDIDFWKDKSDYRSMQLKHDLKMYPPRVIMTVTMKTSTFVLPVKFEGSTKNVLDMELTFPLEYLPVSPSSSVSSGGAHSMKLPLQTSQFVKKSSGEVSVEHNITCPQPIARGSNIQLSDLQLLKRCNDDGKTIYTVNIIDAASHKWKDIACRLSDNPNKASALSQQFGGNPTECLRQLFLDCFINNKPANGYSQDWNGIICLLEDVPLQMLAAKVREMVATEY